MDRTTLFVDPKLKNRIHTPLQCTVPKNYPEKTCFKSAVKKKTRVYHCNIKWANCKLTLAEKLYPPILKVRKSPNKWAELLLPGIGSQKQHSTNAPLVISTPKMVNNRIVIWGSSL
jgi:hypothetical protein